MHAIRAGGILRLQAVDCRSQRSGILGGAALDAAYDPAAGIGDEDGRYLVHSKRSEYLAGSVQGERYGHLVLGAILPQVLRVRPEAGCDSEPTQARIAAQRAELLTGAAASCGSVRPSGREVGLAPRRQKNQNSQRLPRGASSQLEPRPIQGSQGPHGQQIPDSNRTEIAG